jgi:WD40 repeat protein
MAEPAPPTQPDTPQPPRQRRFFQIHLSTAVVLMFVAGVLVWANAVQRSAFWTYGFGWPIPFWGRPARSCTLYSTMSSYPQPETVSSLHLSAFMIDVSAALLIVCAVGGIWEFVIRHAPAAMIRFPRLRFSLRTLLIFVLLVGSAGGLWYRWEPWAEVHRFAENALQSHSPDGSCAILELKHAEPEQRFQLVDLRSGCSRALPALGDNAANRQFIFAPDGRSLVVTGKPNLILNTESWASVPIGDAEFDRVVFSPDGGLIASYLSEDAPDPAVTIWNAAHGRQVTRLVQASPPKDCSFSPSGEKLVSATEETVQVWDTRSWTKLCSRGLREKPDWSGWSCRFSPDGGRVFLGDLKQHVVLDTATLHTVAQFDGYTANFSADGQYVLSVFQDQFVLRDCFSGREVKSYSHPRSNYYYQFGLFPDGIRFFASSQCIDITSMIRDVRTGEIIYSWPRDWCSMEAISDDMIVFWTAPPASSSFWHRRRPEWWWGVAWLPEFWATLLFAGAFGWSVGRDRRGWQKPADTLPQNS